MFSMIISFYLKFHHTDEYDINRYNYKVENITSLTDEQFIAFCLIYLYLKDELLENDKWNTIKSEETDIEEVFAKIDLTEFFSDQLIAFYHDNIELLRKHTKKH